MSKVIPPVIVTLFAVSAAASAQPVAPLAAPPPAPSLKSGQFECKMHDKNGAAFDLQGTMGNWKAGTTRSEPVEFNILAPESTGLSGHYRGSSAPMEMRFFSYDAKTRTSVDATMRASFAPEGMIMIEQQQLNGYTSPTTNLYVGTCATSFSPAAKELS